MSEEVAAALAKMNLTSYAQTFDDEGWDDLGHLQGLDADGLREVAASVKMKTGHVSRLLGGFGKRGTANGDAPPPMLERKTSSVVPVGFGPDGQPVFASEEAGPPAAAAPAAAQAAPPASSESLAAGWCDPDPAPPQQPPPQQPPRPPAPVATPDAASLAAASAARGAVPPSPGATLKMCVGLRIVIEKTHATQKLGLCLAVSKGYLRLAGDGGGEPVGYFTVMALDPERLAAQSGELLLGDMVTSVNGQPVATLQDTTRLLAESLTSVLEVQRLQDEWFTPSSQWFTTSPGRDAPDRPRLLARVGLPLRQDVRPLQHEEPQRRLLSGRARARRACRATLCGAGGPTPAVPLEPCAVSRSYGRWRIVHAGTVPCIGKQP